MKTATAFRVSQSLPGVLPLLTFLSVGTYAILVRDDGFAHIWAGSDEYLASFDANTLPSSLRVGAKTLELTVRALFRALAAFVMVDPQAYPSYPGTPWSFADRGAWLHQTVVPLSARLFALLLLLSPIYWAARIFFKNTALQVLYLTLVMSTVGGGAPVVINFFFTIIQPIINWPQSYYLWSVRLNSNDLAAAGMLHLLALVLVSTPRIRPWQAAVLAGVAQLLYENLGFTTGLTLAVAAIAIPADESRKWREFVVRLTAAGIGASLVLVGLLAGVYANSRVIPFDPSDPSGRLESLGDYAHHYWVSNGQYNFAWLNVSLANLAAVLVFPALAGMVTGLVAVALEGRLDAARARRDFTATTIPLAAFLCTLLLALVNSNWEPGRQALAASTLTVLATAALVRWALARR